MVFSLNGLLKGIRELTAKCSDIVYEKASFFQRYPKWSEIQKINNITSQLTLMYENTVLDYKKGWKMFLNIIEI